MKIDIKKIIPTPKDKWEAIEFMNEAQQRLIQAINIMISCIENNEAEDLEFHHKRMNDFISRYIKQ